MAKVKGKKKKVAVGISGGVDSSVAAALLLDQGYDVCGFFMECWWTHVGCSSEKDRNDAVRVASKLGIPIKVLNYKSEYKKRVIDYFFKEYERGLTPNPDIMCNREIKFGLFYGYALKNGFDYIATGHYARIVQKNEGRGLKTDIRGRKVEDGSEYLSSTFEDLSSAFNLPSSRLSLLRGTDESKDQSYFLYTLNAQQLPRILFPVGGLLKSKVRKIAEEKGLHTSKKPDSQGICFVGEVDIEEFLKERLPEKQGNVLNIKGEIVGSHRGAYFYTVGQRRGFEITKYIGVPVYVIDKDVIRNTVTVGIGRDTERSKFEAGDLNWINDQFAIFNDQWKMGDLKVRIRHLGQLIACTVDNARGDRLRVELHTPQRGIAPGQSAVFYNGEEVLGGGVIQ